MTTCRLNSVNDFVAKEVPEAWTIGVFGSTAKCASSPVVCAAQSEERDLDLLIVYPAGNEVSALRVRKNLIASLASIAIPADVVLLSERELASSDFWYQEEVSEFRPCAQDYSEKGQPGHHAPRRY